MLVGRTCLITESLKIRPLLMISYCMLSDDKDEDEKKAGNQPNTSALVSTGDQSTQKVQYGLKVKRDEQQADTVALQNGFVTLSSDEDDNDLIINEEETQNLEEPGDTESADLSSKVKVTDNDLDLSGSSVDDSCLSPVRLGRHECWPCDYSTETKDDSEQHLIEDSKEPSVQCSVSLPYTLVLAFCFIATLYRNKGHYFVKSTRYLKNIMSND